MSDDEEKLRDYIEALREELGLNEPPKVKSRRDSSSSASSTPVAPATASRRGRGRSARVAEPESPDKTAHVSVMNTVASEVASEAIARTSQYFQIGKEVARAYWRWATSKGIPLEQAMKAPIAEIVTDALIKASEYDRLLEYLRRLEEELAIYRARADPLFRLEQGIKMLIRYGIFLKLAKRLGFRGMERSPISKYFAWLLYRYLTGSPLETLVR